MNYKETLEYFEDLERFGLKLGLENITRLLSLSGHPEKVVRFIHVAGTNGKGSTSAFIASILRAAGLKVGLYTSPHLVRFEERMVVRDQPIRPERLSELATFYRRLIEKERDFSPTFFEVTTAMVFKYFAEEKVDLAVVEVGLGGRLDATNVVRPEVAVITGISQDHVQFLGHRLMDIAREKFAIIKPDTAVVSGLQSRVLREKLKEICRSNRAALLLVGEDIFYRLIRADLIGQEFRLKLKDDIFPSLKIKLLGRYQLGNAAVAVAAIKFLQEKGYRISTRHIQEGLAEAAWPGRFDLVDTNPYIIFDGGHNLEAVRNLKESLKFYFPDKKIILVLGIMADKNWPLMIRTLAPLARLVITCQTAGARACPAESLSAEVSRFNKEVITCYSVGQAMETALREASRDEVICLTGSLYVVGEGFIFLENSKTAILS